MSEARRIQERLTEATRAKDLDAIMRCYSPDAVVITPEGTFRGREEFEAYLRGQFEAFPDLDVVVEHKLDAGDTAADESVVSGTNTGPLPLPTGEVVAPTGKRVTQRTSDFAVVRAGKVVEHRFYYDQVELLAQLEVESPSLQGVAG